MEGLFGWGAGARVWHKAAQPIALADVRFRGTSDLDEVPATSRPSVAAAPFHPGWHRHRMVLADTAPRLLGGMGLRRGRAGPPIRVFEWPANETGRRQGCS